MKTTKEVIENSNIDAGLVRAVVRAIGEKSNLEDVYNHGADAGYCGFTYYNDTVKFAKRHKKAILEMAGSMANDLGSESIYSMIGQFNCLKIKPEEVAEAIYNSKDENHVQVYNALAWFALEEVARAFCDE
jgi:hypothetical protein